MTEFLIATHNVGKFNEIAKLLANFGHTAEKIEADLPAEGDLDLLTNATAKAQATHRLYPHQYVLGDDSGLFVDGHPELFGVHTARQLPRHETNAALFTKIPAGTAVSLRSTLVLISPSNRVQSATGQLQATLTAPQGQAGTGFDQVLIPKGEALTLAQMPPAIRTPYLPRQRALVQLFA
ncbi:non-canonical purine NTP pyrophosphatase [Lacticaseibacillus porcinae]|uniref:non-canonical purine NTP pyrophosphatase n=1 Tax=Lacticaseibacillus porcinae TaxID=1123687 RepID=UPI000F78EC4D|nr:non-canonical purine NTP pyrophosphatase [Lacticaseibacillus porcinae]